MNSVRQFHRQACGVVALLLVLGAHQVPASGSITIVPPSSDDWSTSFGRWNNTLKGYVTPYADCGYGTAFQDLQSAFATQFSSWTVSDGGADLSGTLTVNQYDATATSAGGGAALNATYAPSATDPSLANLQFIQLIYAPATSTTPYIDPVPNDDTLPFYYTTTENSTYKNGSSGTYTFDDHPFRPWPGPPPYSLNWDAVLFLASWDGTSNSVTVYDGVHWGFYFQYYSFPGGMSTAPEPGGLPKMLFGTAFVGGFWLLRNIRRHQN